MSSLRQKVIWLGTKPDDLNTLEFTYRKLFLEFPSDAENIINALPTTRGIVFVLDKENPEIFKKNYLEYGPVAHNYGAKLYAIALDSGSQQIIENILKTIDPKIEIIKRTNPPAHEIAETIARHEPGPPPNPQLKIYCEPRLIDSTSKLFLERVFYDCESIELKQLLSGRSAKTFCVYAVFKDSMAGPRPLPFFVKIDEKMKIEREWLNYSAYVAHFIPFNLRPNVDSYRYILGVDRGIIVGSFVEFSEPLMEVAKRGHAQASIYSLFENTLRGWRLQAQQSTGNILKIMGNLFHPDRISESRINIARQNGSIKKPEELLNILREFRPHPFLYGPLHGDLHAFNIRVRGNDAILIDFATTRNGAIVSDPASLEISLAFEITDDDPNDSEWKTLIDIFYSDKYLKRPFEKLPSPFDKPHSKDWLWKCIRQIRLLALAEQISEYEYNTALAIFLLRWSTFPNKTDNPEREDFRKAYAYAVAEKMILDLERKLLN